MRVLFLVSLAFAAGDGADGRASVVTLDLPPTSRQLVEVVIGLGRGQPG